MLLKEALLELERAGIMKDDCLRFGLTLEEILLDYQRVFTKDAAVAVKLQKKADFLCVSRGFANRGAALHGRNADRHRLSGRRG